MAEFINQFMYDYRSVHVGKDLYRVNDRATNVGGWESVHPGKLAILWRTPGNRNIAGRHVARSFEDVRNLVTTFYGGK